MAKLTIELDPETHENLKKLARKDERSLTQFIQRTLRQTAGTLVINDATSTTKTLSTKEEDEEEDGWGKWGKMEVK